MMDLGMFLMDFLNSKGRYVPGQAGRHTGRHAGKVKRGD